MASKNLDGGATEHQEQKHDTQEVLVVDEKYATGNMIQVQAASVALAAAIAAQKPSLLSKNMLKLYFIMAVGYLVYAMNGFYSSLMGSINAMTPYQQSFGLSGAGSSTGVIFIEESIQASAHAKGQFVGGRFVLGFGAALASAAGPAYTVEMAHPAYRGTVAGMYSSFWWLGNILARWTTYGANKNITTS